MADSPHTAPPPGDVTFASSYLEDLRSVISGLDPEAIATAIDRAWDAADAELEQQEQAAAGPGAVQPASQTGQ